MNAAILARRAVMDEIFGVIECATALGLHGIHEAFVSWDAFLSPGSCEPIWCRSTLASPAMH